MLEDKKKKLKIAIFTDSYLPEINGVATSIARFSKLLADDGHKIMIFCPKYGRYRDEPYPNMEIRRYSSVRFPTNKEVKVSLPFITGVIQDLKKFEPDVVHIQTPLSVGWVSIWATKILKLKNIQTYHTYIPDFLVYLKPKTFLGFNRVVNYLGTSKLIKTLVETDVTGNGNQGKLNKYLSEKIDEATKKVTIDKNSKMTERFGWELTKAVYNRAELVLTPSAVLQKTLKKHGIRPSVEVMSNGVEYDLFQKKAEYVFKKRLIHVGRLGYEKHIDVVVRAVALAIEREPKLTLDIIGDGPARKSLQELAKKLKVEKSIKFLGFKKREELLKMYRQYDAFITASTIETQGIVLLEAMSAGIPVIGVKKLAIPEIVLHGKNGYISRPFREIEMATNISRLYKLDEVDYKRFGQKALQTARLHDIQSCKEKLEKVYYQIANLS